MATSKLTPFDGKLDDEQPASALTPFTGQLDGEKPRTRGLFEAVNDNVIEFANAAAGGVSALANMVKPGNAVSGFIDENIIKAGEQKQSDVVQGAKRQLSQGLDSAKGIGDEVGAVGRYVLDNPLLAASQAAGSFALPGGAVKGAGAAAKALGAGAKGIETAGRVGGIAAGAAMAGGDAAGTAFDLSSKAGATEDQAIAAGRQASVIPALVGGVTGAFGAERLLAGAKGFGGNALSRGLKSGLSEAGQEAVEEGVTQFEGQRAAMPYDATIDPTKGVAGAAAMGGIMGFGPGAVLGAMGEGSKPSQQMGIDPNAGPLSRAAASAVDSQPVPQPLGASITGTAPADLMGRATNPLAEQITSGRQKSEDLAVTRNAFADRNSEALAGGGLFGSRADPLANMIADQRSSEASTAANIDRAAQNRAPMTATEAGNMLVAAREQGRDFTVAPHPDGGFVVVPREWVTPQIAAKAEASLMETLGRVAQVEDAPINRAARVSTEPANLNLNTDPVTGYIDTLRSVNTPAARMFVSEFDAGRITRRDVERRMAAERGKTADERIAEAAAQAKKPEDPYSLGNIAQSRPEQAPEPLIEIPRTNKLKEARDARRAANVLRGTTGASTVTGGDITPSGVESPLADVRSTGRNDDAGTAQPDANGDAGSGVGSTAESPAALKKADVPETRFGDIESAKAALREALAEVDRVNDVWRQLYRDGVAYILGDGPSRKVAPNAPQDIKDRFEAFKKAKVAASRNYDAASAAVNSLTPKKERPVEPAKPEPVAQQEPTKKPRQLNGSDTQKAKALFTLPAGSTPRPDNWRGNAIKAGKVARSLGLDPKGKRLKEIVAEIDAVDAGSGAAAKPVSREQAIRDAWRKEPRTIGKWTPISVEAEGQKADMLVNQKRAGGDKDGALHVVNIRMGKMLKDMEREPIAYTFRLTADNRLVEEGIPTVATPGQIAAWKGAGFALDDKPANVQNTPSSTAGTEAQAAPVEARAPEGGNAASDTGVPAAGDTAAMENNGVKSREVMPAGLTLEVGGRFYPVESLAQASEMVSQAKQKFTEAKASGKAGGFVEDAPIRDDAGRIVGYVGRGGSVFDVPNAGPRAKKLYDAGVDLAKAVGEAEAAARPALPKPASPGAGDVQADGVREAWGLTREQYFNDPARVRREAVGPAAVGWKASYEYTNPSGSGPFKGSTVLKVKPNAGDTINAPFGRARVTAVSAVKGASIDNAELLDIGKAHHRRVVADAIASGKPVPDDVLAEYPDLSKNPRELNTSAEPVQKTSKNEQVAQAKTEAPAENKFAEYDALARQYGYEVRPDGSIGSNGKFPGVTMSVKKGRLRFEGKSGNLLASYAPTPESLGKFLESFWYAEKTTKAPAAAAKTAQPKAEKPAEDNAFMGVEDQTQTEAFKKWFGDSKVVDADGKPLVVYHGTRGDFNEFGNIGGRFKISAGYYFTSSQRRASVYADSMANAAVDWNSASTFAKDVEQGANVMPVYLSIKNPLIITDKDGPFNSPEDAFDLNDGALVKAAKDLGHDGVIFKRNKGDGYDEIAAVAFRPKQIKSAIGNRGTFDPENPDITFAGTKDKSKRQGTPVDRAIMDMAGEGREANEILSFIAKSSKSPYRRQLAQKLLATKANPAVSIGGDMGSKDGYKNLALYSRKNHEIQLAPEAEYKAEQIFLHEAIHSATLLALDRKTLFGVQMNKLYESVKEQGLSDAYGMKNVGEFVAEAFTNPDFQKALKGMKADNGSLWDRLVNIVRRILGMEPNQQDALSAALDLGAKVMRENMPLRAARSFRAEDGPAFAGSINGMPDNQAPGTQGDAQQGADKGNAVTQDRPSMIGKFPVLEKTLAEFEADPDSFVEWLVDAVGDDLAKYAKEGEVVAVGIRSTPSKDELGKNPRHSTQTEGGGMRDTAKHYKLPGTSTIRIAADYDYAGYDQLVEGSRYAFKEIAKYVKLGTGYIAVVAGRNSPANKKGIALDDGELLIEKPKVIAYIRAIQNDQSAPDTDGAYFGIADAVEQIKAFDVKSAPKNTWAHYRGMALQTLGRRQLVDLYGDEFGTHMHEYDSLVQQMDAEKNETGAEADDIAQRWGKLKDEKALAELMHDATLAKMDPDKPMPAGYSKAEYDKLKTRFNTLSPEAKTLYREARDMYVAHYKAVQQAIKDRIERSEMSPSEKKRMMAQLDDKLFKELQGVYFPLARFGQYVIVVKDANGEVKNVTRAETVKEAEQARKELQKAFPAHMGNTVGKVLKQAEFNAGRDAVGKGFMADLMNALDEKGVDDELRDTVAQLYLSSLPDLSWAKHGIHRKGTPGFSQDARRAFAQNAFHGARYLAKLRYSDRLQDELTGMQDYVKAFEGVEEYDSIQGQQVVDEMVKRHEILMNPKSSPVSTALTSFGFLFHMGLSPASAMVNLTQTALVAYPQMGAKWGFGKAGAALTKASEEVVRAKNDLSKSLKGDELAAFDRAVKDGTIDVTMAHDLAGIAQGEDQGVMWKVRPVMRWASFMFHHAEKFNRQATFLAAYRLSKETNQGRSEDWHYEEAKKATYDGHFDYSAANRARIMQGNWQRVILLFKQYSQSMIYTLARNAYQSIKAIDPKERTQARKTLGGILAAHAAAAGVLGLPIVGPLLTVASWIGGDDDEPWDAEVAMQNAMAEMIGPKAAEVVARGFSRLTPFDLSGRVALNKLILPDVQEGLEGKEWAESAMAAALGPVAGIGLNMARGAQKITEGDYLRGLEDMMPTALRGPLKALRYANEGAVDKTGVVITDEVSAAGVLGQASGFSPSQVRRDTERRSAIYAYDRALLERRSVLMRMMAEARIQGDTETQAEVQKDIQRFNEKNPTRRITPMNIAQSVRNRRKRIDEAEQGVYLPSKRRDALDAVSF